MAPAAKERRARLRRAADEGLWRSKAELRHEHKRLDTVLQSLDDGLFIVDRRGRVTLANAAAGEVLRELASGRCGASSTGCVWRQDGRGDAAPRTCLECLAGDRRPARRCEAAVGGRVYELHGTPVCDRGREETERVFVSRDVTERRRQEARQAHQERLSVLGEVAAVMAHELNNPLAAISMFSQMLLEGLDVSSPLYTHAEVIHRNIESCKGTVRSLLDMTASSPATSGDFELRDLVGDVVELLRPIAAQGGTALRAEADGTGVTRGDELQLRQALINLVMNAIHAAGEVETGEVTVATGSRAGEFLVRVRDNGPGVPPELQQRIFEPFYTTRLGEGTGLGLPTARRIVEAHGGTLTLRFGSAGGTTFEMVLPRRAASGEMPAGAVAGEGRS